MAITCSAMSVTTCNSANVLLISDFWPFSLNSDFWVGNTRTALMTSSDVPLIKQTPKLTTTPHRIVQVQSIVGVYCYLWWSCCCKVFGVSMRLTGTILWTVGANEQTLFSLITCSCAEWWREEKIQRPNQVCPNWNRLLVCCMALARQ